MKGSTYFRRNKMKRDELLCALTLLLMVFSFRATAEGWNDAVAAYSPVLAQYMAAFTRNEGDLMNRESAESAYLFAQYAQRDPREVIGYSFPDLNRDGVPELVIGTLADEEDAEDQLIFEILTLKDDVPVTVMRGWERFWVQLTRNENSLTSNYGYYAEGSSGAANSVYEYGLAGADMTQWEEVCTLEVNYDESLRSNWTLNGMSISENEAQARIESRRKHVFWLPLTPFMEDNSRRDTGFTDAGTPDAAERFCRSYRITPAGPTVDLVIADTGRRNAPEVRHENVLSVEITVRETGQTQRFDYDGTETPATDSMSCLAWLQDINFDGYGDLMLCTARGASNECSVFCLWNTETGRFDDIKTHCAFDLETERFSSEITPLELVNFTLQESSNGGDYVISNDLDGIANYSQFVYRWEGNAHVPELTEVHDVSGVGRSLIRDRVFLFLSQGEKVWDHVYPEEWYYGATEPYMAFRTAADSLWQGRSRATKHVDNVEWVNLREQDSKQSASLARLDRHTSVEILMENCADGWTLVLWDTGELQEEWFGNRTEIGYIWHSLLD